MIFREGRRVGGDLARLAAAPGKGRVGFAVPRRIGDHPRRNRARRRFREAIRTQTGLVEERLDYVLILSQEGADAPFPRIQEEVRTLFEAMRKRWEDDLES